MLLRTKHSCKLVLTKVTLLSNVVESKFNTNPLALIMSIICSTHFYMQCSLQNTSCSPSHVCCDWRLSKITTRLKLPQQKLKGRSESCFDMTMTSPVTKKNSKSGHWGILRKSHFSIFHPALTIKQLG